MAAPGWYRWDAGDLVLSLRVQPRAKRDEVLGPAGDHLRVRITAPPVEGKANEHLRGFLADLFGVVRSQVILLAGERGRVKRVRIRDPVRLPQDIGLGEKEGGKW
jgi:uncharacterized protein (TIGR00251 family)